MVVLNTTAFGIYRLLGTFGPFHVAAILSLATLMMGFLPALFRTTGNWIGWHVPGMYYSIVGLYAALAAEIVVRVPMSGAFFVKVLLATVLVTFIGVWNYRKASKKWIQTFNKPNFLKKRNNSIT